MIACLPLKWERLKSTSCNQRGKSNTQVERTLIMLRDFSKENFDIIILAGQSNGDGYGYGDVAAPFEPNEKIWDLSGDFTISITEERVYGNHIRGNLVNSFAVRYLETGCLYPGRKLLIVRAAVAGTGFTEPYKNWGLTDNLYLRMIDMTHTALGLNPSNELVALLWHQGEAETTRSTYEKHKENLTTLIKSVRSEFDRDSLPFIAGDFCHPWSKDNEDICKPIVSAIRDVCSDIDRAAFVETDGLLANNTAIGDDDAQHFSRDALYKLGERYFDAFDKLIRS